MLYGNIIFIKKTGGDGSKFPVTEKIIKIGKSEECLIRIYNSQVAPEHCHLIIEENGQAVLRNLSNQTILNGKPLSNKDVVLCHGDIFKLGERLARWEYLPTSKYYRQLLSPTGRLVAVVMPQQRPLGEQVTPRASVSQGNVSKNTPLGKRRYSDLSTAENSPAVKVRKSSGSELVRKSKGNLSKLLIGRHSLKSSKLMVQSGKPKERKSTSGMISSKTPKGQSGGKLRKSTLPLWKVNIVSPQGEMSLTGRSSLKRESVKSPNSAKSSPKDKIGAESSSRNLSTSKSKMKTPQKALSSKLSEETSASQNVLKTPLKTIEESPSRSSRRSPRSQLTLKKSPKKTSLKSPSNIVSSTPQSKFPKSARLIHSESKISSTFEKQSSLPRGSKRKTLMFEKVNLTTPKKSLTKSSPVKAENEDSQNKTSVVVSDKILQSRVSDNLFNETSITRKTSPRVSVKNTPVLKSSRKSKETKSKSSAKKTPKNVTVFTPVKDTEKPSRTSRTSVSKKLEIVSSEGNTSLVNSGNISIHSPKSTPLKKTPAKSVKKIQKTQTPSSSRKISTGQNETRLSSISSSDEKTSDLSPVRFSQRKSKFSLKKIEATEGKSSSPSKGTTTSRGIQRKLSPSSSAEIAAKKLKTSSPKKPDKNKKAALLVLGKANRKHLIPQNVKVLLKQKIVKKALKQSVAGSGHTEESKKKAASKMKKGLQKKTKAGLKSKKFVKVNKSSKQGTSPSKTSKTSDASAISFPATNVNQENTSKDNKFLEESQLNASKVLQTPSRLSSKSIPVEAIPNFLSKEKKKSESSFKVDHENISPSNSFEKNAESYLLNSLRRSSKRLSSKNDTGRPDFIELSPTALGLMPKNLEIFKTPKEHKRRSSSLVTPKNIRTAGIIKSASTSKIVNRKSVRFSPKNVSYNSEFSSPNFSDKTEFDFSSFHTPNITMDVFISPLSEKSNVSKKGLNESKIFVEEEMSRSPNINSKSALQPTLCIQKLRQSKKGFDITSAYLGSPKSPVAKVTSPVKVSRENKSSENNLSDLKGLRQLFETPKSQKSPKNSLSDLKGVSKLLRTPKVMKSPKNELINLTGVKEVLRTPKMRRSPKNDLTDVRGVKKLLQTPKAQKSPKNDLTDVKGVKKLLQTPKVQKSPKNDLTDVRGVKKLLRTPKVQKSPKNDLTDVRGVKKLLRTPKVQKSPKNDLTDVRGVKKLLRTPKAQKSPKNDLTDVRGVKKLLGTPKVQKSPKNDLTDVRGVKKLLKTPKTQKSPKNDLTDVRGVKKLLQTPKVQKSPKNELSDLRGVKKLLGSPKLQKSPKNNLLDISGMGDLFKSPSKQDLPESSADYSEILSKSLQSEESLIKNLTNITEVKQLLISKSPENISKDKKTVSRKSCVKEFKAIRGRRTIYSTPKGPKNDLSDVMGVRELFIRHKPTSDYNVDLTGVAELFDLSEFEADSKPLVAESVKKSPLQVAGIKSLKRRKLTESQDEKDENVKPTTRGTRLKKAARSETGEEGSKNSKAKAADFKERKPTKRKAVEKVKTVSAKKTAVRVKKSDQATEKPGDKLRTRTKVKFEDGDLEAKSTRKRKAVETPGLSPPKLRRKLRGAEESSSSEAKDTPQKSLSRSKSKAGSERKIVAKRVQKVSAKVKDEKKPEVSPKVQIKKAIKTSGAKQTQKVQSKRSQSKSKIVSGSVSPRKTRSARVKISTEKVSVRKAASAETVSKTAGVKKPSPVIKRSTRRKVK